MDSKNLDSVLKVKNTLVVRSDTMNYEERSRSSTLLKKRPTLGKILLRRASIVILYKCSQCVINVS